MWVFSRSLLCVRQGCHCASQTYCRPGPRTLNEAQTARGSISDQNTRLVCSQERPDRLWGPPSTQSRLACPRGHRHPASAGTSCGAGVSSDTMKEHRASPFEIPANVFKRVLLGDSTQVNVAVHCDQCALTSDVRWQRTCSSSVPGTG